MKLSQPAASIFVPDGQAEDAALSRTTHLGIGAHPDDLEFMALHGILECYNRPDHWFGGITCTNGSGSIHFPGAASLPESDLVAVRRREQEAAARIGRYSFVAQLDHSSAAVKMPAGVDFPSDLRALFTHLRPRVVYTHNPADQHATHVAVAVAALQILRALPADRRPARVLGCEVWRSLDWLPDHHKVILDLGGYEDLSGQLVRAFGSQIQSGKRYDLALPGRQHANATFLDPRSPDGLERAALAMDLTPLVRDERLHIDEYVDSIMGEFRNDVRSALDRCLSDHGKTPTP